MSTLSDRKRVSKARAFAAVAVILVAAVAVSTWHIVHRMQADEIRRVVSERLALYETTIHQTIGRFSYLPHVLSRDPRVEDLLRNPLDPAGLKSVNSLLQDIAARSGASALYVMNAQGLTLAASNWDKPLTFVGNNYAFRPYFTGAMKTGAGQFYGVGVTTGEAGYFIAALVGPLEAPLGVVTVKIGLSELERKWQVANESVLLADEKGVVFLASRASWVYRPLSPLSAGALKLAQSTHQYGDADLTSRPLTAPGSDLTRGRVMLHEETGAVRSYAVLQKALPEYHWTIAVLRAFDEVERMAVQAAALAGLSVCVILLAVVVWMQRRATIRAKLRAHDELERRVRERTQELVLANDRLGREVEQRISAEQHLRQTQDELMQAGKLAALGHMSAALSHEINQPLAALRTYLSSTARLADQGNLPAVAGNIGRMGQLVARMADITAHLKRFARVEAGAGGTACLDSALNNALALLEARIAAEQATVTRQGEAAGLVVQGSESRLEQVFVNLLSNALDAVKGRERREITLRVFRRLTVISVEVEDTGPGVPPEYHGLIFAPYFTTKEVGSGLGLGLSISHTIMKSFGGSLAVRQGAGGGALFVARLKAAPLAAQAALEAAE
jgi:two-component system C4-dicarboxylate transport sensor histidine kinase DctB